MFVRLVSQSAHQWPVNRGCRARLAAPRWCCARESNVKSDGAAAETSNRRQPKPKAQLSDVKGKCAKAEQWLANAR